MKQKGFTLIEVIISIVIIAVIFVMIAQAYYPMLHSKDPRKYTQAFYAAQELMEYMEYNQKEFEEQDLEDKIAEINNYFSAFDLEYPSHDEENEKVNIQVSFSENNVSYDFDWEE